MFEIGDYVVYPGHGVGQILAREEKSIGDQTLATYTLKIMSNGMKMIVPERSNSLRALVTQTEVEDIYRLLGDHSVKPSRETWNRRYRDYMGKVNSGSVIEIADVLRQLLILKFSKKLSFGEKKMLDLCRDLLVREISLTTGTTEQEIINRIDAFFQ